ncbi:MAG: hypothetical protein ACKO8W_06815 [Dolichospermum sp.]
MRYKVKSCNACGAGILPARYVPHNIGKCCKIPFFDYVYSLILHIT